MRRDSQLIVRLMILSNLFIEDNLFPRECGGKNVIQLLVYIGRKLFSINLISNFFFVNSNSEFLQLYREIENLNKLHESLLFSL